MQISPKFLSSFFLNKLAERESERDLISPKLMSSFFPQQTSKEKREREREEEESMLFLRNLQLQKLKIHHDLRNPYKVENK